MDQTASDPSQPAQNSTYNAAPDETWYEEILHNVFAFQLTQENINSLMMLGIACGALFVFPSITRMFKLKHLTALGELVFLVVF